MKKIPVFLIALLITVATVACAQEESAAEMETMETAKPESLEDRVSYSIGLNLGRSLKQQQVDVNIDLVLQGLEHGLGDADALLSDQEMQETMQTFQQELQAKMQERRAAAAEENKAAGEQFLAENAERPEVTTTDSGLQYEVLEEGDGPSPNAEDEVTVHYEGTLPDGTVFDSSYERGQPASFPLSGVISGWTEALQLMQVGDKWKIVLPPNLAYGPQGQGQAIGPNQTLIFEVELLGIERSGEGDGGGAGEGGEG